MDFWHLNQRQKNNENSSSRWSLLMLGELRIVSNEANAPGSNSPPLAAKLKGFQMDRGGVVDQVSNCAFAS